ncbi:MAG: hypothetical protein ABSF43_04795 [Rectinemataceae bacterium]|jgi:hypothetical protein
MDPFGLKRRRFESEYLVGDAFTRSGLDELRSSMMELEVRRGRGIRKLVSPIKRLL